MMPIARSDRVKGEGPMAEYRVLLVYPNTMMSMLPPNAIGLLSAYLKREGYVVDLFDATLYKTAEDSSDERKMKHLQVRPFNLVERGVTLKTSEMEADFRQKVERFKPDLLAVSMVEDTFPIGIRLLNVVADLNIPTVMGGVFATHAPHLVIAEPTVQYLCRGEGEAALLDLCRALSSGKDPSRIPNLWIKSGDTVIKNDMRPALDVNQLPIQDLSIFEPCTLFRPLAGKIWRMAPIETQRGCPFTCTFCNSPANSDIYKEAEAGRFYRKRTMEHVYNEITTLRDRYEIEFIFFITDTFLAMSEAEFDEFIEMYSSIKLPFFMNTRPETLSLRRAKMLKDVNCYRVNIGVEHGNQRFRREVVGRPVSDEQMINAFKYMNEAGIPVVANNIIGFPDETREGIFETIELNRKYECDTINAFTFSPYHGTRLRELALKRGYLKPEERATVFTKDSVLNMPHLSKAEIRGLMKTFALYVKLPKEYWPRVRVAERGDEEGHQAFEELSLIYNKYYAYNRINDDEV